MENLKTKKIIDEIARIRKKDGISCEYIADKLTITTAGYWKIENGYTNLSVERLFQISEILGISLSVLLEEVKLIKL